MLDKTMPQVPAEGARHKLLIGASSPRTQLRIRTAGERLGFAVSVAADIERFRGHLRDERPQIVVLDITVGDVFAVDAIHDMQSSQNRFGVILLSGPEAEWVQPVERLVSASGLPLHAVLRKPVDSVNLESELQHARDRQLVQRRDLEQAIHSGDIAVKYLPAIDLHAENGWAVSSVEVLARWAHPKLGQIHPEDFIAAAERYGLVAPLSLLILQRAMTEFPASFRAVPGVALSVNASLSLFETSEFMNEVTKLAKGHGLEPGRISFEMREADLEEDPVLARDALHRIRDRGFRSTVDDFGQGGLALARLCRLPLSELKVDPFLVRDMNESDEARVILELIIDLSRRLQLKVCAEGVENRSNLELLRSVGCDRAQGYYFSRPLSLSDLERKVRPGNGSRLELHTAAAPADSRPGPGTH